MSRVWKSVPLRVRDIITVIIRREGGFVDHPADPGGATNMGITFHTFRRWRGEDATVEELKALSINEAIQIYYQLFWEPLNIDGIDNWWAKDFIFDFAINAGPNRVIKRIQKIIGVQADGIVGPITQSAFNDWANSFSFEKNLMKDILIADRHRYYIRLCKSNHSLITFLEEWFNRTESFRR